MINLGDMVVILLLGMLVGQILSRLWKEKKRGSPCSGCAGKCSSCCSCPGK